MKIKFAEDDRASGFETANNLGIFRGNAIFEKLTGCGRPQPGCIHDVL
jgi:hypothetical protein